MKIKAYMIAWVAFIIWLGSGLLLSSDSGVLQWLKSAVIMYPPPTISLTASPSSVPMGWTTTVYWTTRNTVSCTEATYGVQKIAWSVVTAPLYSPLNLRLTCKGKDGSIVSKALTIQITPNAPTPTISLTAKPTTVASGSTATVYWESKNTVACSEATYGSVALQWSVVTSPLTAPLNLKLTCIWMDRSVVTKSLTINVTTPTTTTPTIEISASPSVVPSGSATTVSWVSKNTVSCSEANYGAIALEWSIVTPKLISDLAINITCIGRDGTLVNRVFIVRVQLITPPNMTLTANPTSVTSGSSTTITWSTTGMSSCTEATYGSVALNWSVLTAPLTAPLNLRLTCIGTNGSVNTKSLSVPIALP